MYKRVICFVVVIGVLIGCLSISAFCVLDAALAGEAVAGVLDAYGMYYGVGSSYRVSSSSGVGDVFESSWNGFNEYLQNNGESTYDILDVYHNMQHVSNTKPFVSSFTHSSGKFAGFYVDSESSEIFDKFWNWLLSGPAQMQIVDNQFQWNYDQQDVIVSPTVASFNGFPLLPVTYNSYSDLSSRGFYAGHISSGYNLYVSSSAPSFLASYLLGSDHYLVALSPSSGSSCYFTSSSSTVRSNAINSSSSDFYYVILNLNGSLDSLNSSIPVFSSLSAVLNAFSGRASSTEDISLVPYSSDPDYDPSSDPPPPISLPIVSAQDYSPVAVEIVTVIPWDEDEYGDVYPLPDANLESLIQDIADAISASDFALLADPNPVDPEPVPPASEVFTPIFTPDYPSFNFNFSGIWHYVRDWVSSLGSWFSLVFTVWSHLPYAIVLPVYASAVIVVVLGVYKRFFM